MGGGPATLTHHQFEGRPPSCKTAERKPSATVRLPPARYTIYEWRSGFIGTRCSGQKSLSGCLRNSVSSGVEIGNICRCDAESAQIGRQSPCELPPTFATPDHRGSPSVRPSELATRDPLNARTADTQCEAAPICCPQRFTGVLMKSRLLSSTPQWRRMSYAVVQWK